jgi:hypothetical protein
MAFSKGIIKDFLTKVLIGLGLGIASDAGVEILRVPVLNDSGTFGDPMMSNFEYAAYAISVFGTAAGIADIGVGTGVLTFTKTGFPVLIGYGLGVYLYEHTLAVISGVRKYNPYEIVGSHIPAVIPSSIPHPFVHPGQEAVGLGNFTGGPLHPTLRS